MSKQVNIHEAKTHLSRLIEEAIAGEDIVIAKAGQPKVRLAVIETAPQLNPFDMLFGALRGQLGDLPDVQWFRHPTRS